MEITEAVYREFVTDGTFLSAQAYGSGHIHDTFRVTCREQGHPGYILQRLNTRIFPDVDRLQSNIITVTDHIRRKLEASGAGEIDRRVLRVIPSGDGRPYYRDPDGRYWRMYIFISNHLSFDIVESGDQARQGGIAIGRFQAQLADLDSSLLHETIPGFHNIERRLEMFEDAVSRDPHGRAGGLSREIDFVRSRAERMGEILRLGRSGHIPVRTTHNDTKFNNVLLDQDFSALCVIDLDTVMPGYVHYDFGDAIRTAASSCAEDEKDLSKVYLNIGLFRAYTEGYLSEVRSSLTATELEYLHSAPALITFTIGLRFLSDYIEGDTYFKTHYPGQNLVRTRTQFRLVESNEEQAEVMKQIVANC